MLLISQREEKTDLSKIFLKEKKKWSDIVKYRIYKKDFKNSWQIFNKLCGNNQILKGIRLDLYLKPKTKIKSERKYIQISKVNMLLLLAKRNEEIFITLDQKISFLKMTPKAQTKELNGLHQK